MSKEETMNPILKAVGATEWLNAGYKGQGIKVWNCESNGGHGANSRQMVLDVAPMAEVTSIGFSYASNGDILTTKPTTEDGQDVSKFVKDNKFDIITASLIGNKNKEYVEYMKTLFNSEKTVVLNCAGNEGESESDTISTRFPAEVCIIMGALNYVRGKFVKASYSSIGKELDFMQSVAWWSGTSAATPFQAGLCAIIMSRYGRMSIQEMYKYLQMISKDLGNPGFDTYHGWGQPILPPLNKKYITMTTASNDYFVDGKKYTIDTKPVNKEGNVFVPIRAISEGLGKAVEWKFNADKTINVIITDANTKVELNTGSDIMYKNGAKVILNFAPYIDANNRTLVPIRAIAEAFNCKVDWVQSESKVMILEV